MPSLPQEKCVVLALCVAPLIVLRGLTGPDFLTYCFGIASSTTQLQTNIAPPPTGSS